MTSASDSADTRAKLLDAAEELLATVTYGRLRTEDVCAAAGADPTAVQEHFGSKDGLVAALLLDRFEPASDHMLESLGGESATIADIVDAVLDPLITMQASPKSAPVVHVLAQFVLSNPDTPWSSEWFRLDVWTKLLTSKVAGLEPDVARRRWRFTFTVIMTELTAPQEISPDNVAALRDFLIAGLAGLPKGIQ
ncbi:TetR/AcrR family transcriptional regulator [Gordonia sp. (in: high G+C Gram-positive bacteria)]|uniref:TetR/AcrR family transcriptional regulator n=1 Tax=Gordonia sp. (in: high G+C Gram-positive bacteria) TaxID=84139 RepID=UPI003C709656